MAEQDKLDLILEKLNAIEKRLDKIENSCGAMDTHIGFVDGVYTTVRTPLDFIVNKVSLLAGEHSRLILPEKT
jgi:hypothetical protein